MDDAKILSFLLPNFVHVPKKKKNPGPNGYLNISCESKVTCN